MSHKPVDTFFFPLVDGNVKTTGGSLNLAVGQLAIVDLNQSATNASEGLKVLSDFSDLKANSKLQIRMGEPNDYVSRSENNKAINTMPFKLSDITNIYVDAPTRAGVKVDDFIIGYNGKDGSELDISAGENEVIELTLKGDLIGMTGAKDCKEIFRVNLTAPLESERTKSTTAGAAANQWTMQELVRNAYTELKKKKIPGGHSITDYVDILLVDSTNGALTGQNETFYTLTVKDNGTQDDLGKVQGQYPTLKVERKEWDKGMTTYVTVAGSAPAAYAPKKSFVLKGCDACPAGYTEIAQGTVYQVVLENDGADATTTVQALPGAVADSAVLNDVNGDTTTYSVVLDNELTQAEIDTFVTANPTAQFELISSDVADLCASAAPATTAWVEGETCVRQTETYQIRVADTKCGASRLAELQAAYPELTITEVASSDTACQRTYQTSVVTNLICDNECDNIFRDLFESEAPADFENVSWTSSPITYNGAAKMGIRVRGKRSTLSGNEFLRDSMPFIDDSVEINLAGGFPMYTNESYLAGTNDRFAVKILSRKAKAQNLGGNMRKYEEEAQMEHRGVYRYHDNFAKIALGQTTRFEGTTQYIDYGVTIAPLDIENNFAGAQTNARTYHFPVELGLQGPLEDLLNKLATARGLPQVQAVSK